MKKKTLYIVPLVFFLLLSLLSCQSTNKKTAVEKTPPKNNQKILKGQYFFLNSILDVKIFDDQADQEKILTEIQDTVTKLENKFTLHSPDSEVSKINQKAGLEKVTVSPDVFSVIERSLYYSQLSQGSFDISVGDLVRLWGIGTDQAQVPTQADIDQALKHIDYTKIQLNSQDPSVYLKEKGMYIDLGAIAKGYVADQINQILDKYQVQGAIVNLGGNVYAKGQKGERPFNIGIRNPLSKDPNDYMGICHVKDKTIVTSGPYERFFIQEGKTYHHILSTSTGYPVDNDLLSTTIITKSSTDADALSTVTFTLGLEKGLSLVEKMPEIQAIFITKDKKVYTTSGIKNDFEIVNTDFTLASSPL